MRKSLAIFLAVLLTLGIPGMGVSAAGSSVTVAADKAVYYLDAGETAANLTLTATGVLGTARYTISVAKDAGAPTTSSPELLPNSNTHAWTLPFSGTGKYEVTVSILELDESMGFSETCHASAVFTVRNHAKVAFDQPLPSVYAGPEATLPITLSGFIADDAPITLTGPTQPDGTADSRQLAGNGPETVVLKDLAIGQRTATVEAAGVEPALAYSTDQVEFDVLPNALSLTMGGPYKLHDTGVTIRAELGATYTADDATIDIQVDGLTGGTLTQYGSYAELVFDADDLSEEVPHAYAVTATAVDNATSIVLSDEAAAEIGIGLYEAAVASAAPAYKVDETAAFTATLDKFPVADAEAEFYLDGALFATEDISTGTATAAIDLAAEGVDVGTHAVAAKVFVQGEEYSALSAEESFDVELYDLTFSAGPYYLNGTDASLDVALTNYGGSTPEIEYVITGPGGPFGPYLSDGNTTDVTIDLPAEGIGAGIYEVSAKATLNGLLLAQDNAPMEVIRYNLDVADASFMIDDATAKLEATSDYGDFDEVLFSIDGYGDELALGNELPIDPVAIGPGS
ncbi:MAG: hypothetical protein LBG83_08120, partial [Oscillospiraceae bacterium]|nr:hypothetical protein [Oscillospiraceae bacterium]